MYKVGIVGATGYTGLELCRLLLSHPEVCISHVFSKQHAGKKLIELAPHLHALQELVLLEFNPEKIPDLDVLFLALPHGQSHAFLEKASKQVRYIIDLSADFRLSDAALFEKYYGIEHENKPLLKEVVFGIPELYRHKIAQSQLCANPGCYPTCSILGLYPLVEAGYVKNTVVIDAKSGVSGAGKTLKETSLFCEAQNSVSAYGTQNHRHLPEIESTLGISALFSPHLMPMSRGMLASIYVDTSLRDSEIFELYHSYYKNEPFVKLFKTPVTQTKYVAGSNHCFISFKACPEIGKVVIFSAIDNLVKGASGQAVQNMNVLLGLTETLGLAHLPNIL